MGHEGMRSAGARGGRGPPLGWQWCGSGGRAVNSAAPAAMGRQGSSLAHARRRSRGQADAPAACLPVQPLSARKGGLNRSAQKSSSKVMAWLSAFREAMTPAFW